MKQSRNIEFCLKTKQFLHGKRADYCVYENGTITRTWKKSMVEEKVKPYLHKGKLAVRCGNMNLIVKHLVAQAFIPGYKKGLSVVCVDRDERNCHVDNLCVCSSRALGKMTGWKSKSKMVAVFLPSGEEKVYRSIRQAAKALHCSYQTLLDYLGNAVKKSVLDGIRVHYVGE